MNAYLCLNWFCTITSITPQSCWKEIKNENHIFFCSSSILLSAWFLAPVYQFPLRTESCGSHLLWSLHPQASDPMFLPFPKSLINETLIRDGEADHPNHNSANLLRRDHQTITYLLLIISMLITLITSSKGEIYIPRETKALSRTRNFSTVEASCYW